MIRDMHNLWQNFVTSGNKVKEDSIEGVRLKFINILCLLSTVATSMQLINSIISRSSTAFAEIFFIIVAVILVVFLRIKPLINLFSTLFIVTIYSTTFSFFLLPSQDAAYGLLPLTLIPILSISLAGKKAGLIASLVFVSIVIGSIIGWLVGVIPLAYKANSLMLAIIVYLFSLIFIYIYQDVVEKKEKTITEQNTNLQDSLTKIDQEVQVRKKAEAFATEQSEKLKVQNDELSRMNKIMVDRELRMAEMKKRIAELENQLGIKTL